MSFSEAYESAAYSPNLTAIDYQEAEKALEQMKTPEEVSAPSFFKYKGLVVPAHIEWRLYVLNQQKETVKAWLKHYLNS